MASIRPFNAYKETRLNLESATPGSTVQIRLPTSSAAPAWPQRSASRRQQVAEVAIAEDDNVFKHRHLASEASIYHRQHPKSHSPRSFIWKVLEERKVLSIRAIDISKQPRTPDANLTLRLYLPSAIRPGCVAFADSDAHDVLSVFVLLDTNQFYTLSLRPDFFRKTTSTEDNVEDWCKIIVPTAYITKQIPHRLAALSADEVIISNYDGGITRLARKSGGDGRPILPFLPHSYFF